MSATSSARACAKRLARGPRNLRCASLATCPPRCRKARAVACSDGRRIFSLRRSTWTAPVRHRRARAAGCASGLALFTPTPPEVIVPVLLRRRLQAPPGLRRTALRQRDITWPGALEKSKGVLTYAATPRVVERARAAYTLPPSDASAGGGAAVGAPFASLSFASTTLTNAHSGCGYPVFKEAGRARGPTNAEFVGC